MPLHGRVLLPLLALALLAAPASASTVTNPAGTFGVLTVVPTAGAEANALTIAYTAPSGSNAGGYTVHDATTPVTIGAPCTGCTQSDPNTVFVPAAGGVIATTGDTASSLTITGQENLAGAGTNVLTGGAGNDTLVGGWSSNVIDGRGGNDTLTGGPGGDTFVSSTGNDSETGGAGNDSFQTADGDGADTFAGGPGIDLADYSSRAAAVSVTEDATANDGVAGEGDNVGGVESVNGTPFGDTVSVSGNTPGGIVSGGTGDDTITGSAARETINGDAGNDVLKGSGGSDNLNGGLGNDTIGGGSGDDQIAPGNGNDTVDGGPGNDSFTGIADGDGADAWTGGPGRDTIDYGNDSGPVSITPDGVANDGAAGENDNVAADIEEIIGTPEADTITGGAVDNFIQGRGGADILNGGDGNDTVYANGNDGVGAVLNGGDGNDSLLGGSGDDTLDGGAGDDALNGNEGADVLAGGPGTDSVSFVNTFFAGGVNISANGVADDGRPGQGANVGTDVENFTGSFGPDTITGTPGVKNVIDGSGGGDKITVASSPADADTVYCRSTSSVILARGFFNPAGGGNDTVTADSLDRVSNQGTTACATINRPAKGGPKAKILSSTVKTPSRSYAISFQCVSAVPRCHIVAQVESPDGTVLGRGTIDLGSGRRGQLLFEMGSSRRHQLDQGKKLQQRVVAEVRDSRGVPTELEKTITLVAK